MSLKKRLIELYNRTTCYENGVILKNITQNLIDYLTLSTGKNYKYNNENIYIESLNILFSNCQNSIALLNALALTYGIEEMYKGDLNSREGIHGFTIDFVVEHVC